MANLLNYKYEIYPTRPQRQQLNRILRESRIQWNKAVTIRRKLKRSLASGQIEHVIKTCLSLEKNNKQAVRNKAILRFQETKEEFKSLDFDSAANLYDIKNLMGKTLEVEGKHLDIKLLSKELKNRYDLELVERKKAEVTGVDRKKLPKLNVFWQLRRGIDQASGFLAKTYMDKSFEAANGMAVSTVRFNISGSANSIRWNQAVQPKKGQREYGAIGEPNYKRQIEGFTDQIQQKKSKSSDLIRKKNRKSGHQIHITALHKGNSWIDMAYHRVIPEGSKIKQLTVNAKAGRFFVVLSAEVPDIAWKISSSKLGWSAGIDPGAETALTVALQNSKTGELKHLAIHYGFLERSLEKLEKTQQALALKQGPRRKRTDDEIVEALTQFKGKSSFKKLKPDEQKKEIERKKERLAKTMIRQDASNKWRHEVKKVSELQMKITSQRSDVLHKISRALAEGCDIVGIGHWEPERQVSYRKKLREARRKVKIGIPGADKELKAIEEEKSKQGPKGSKKRRRGGRDRSIATLRRLFEEKAERASIEFRNINEAWTTITCCACGEQTGPRKDLTIREWRCTKCNTLHNRDLNSGFNILRKTEIEIAAAQAAALETGRTVTRTKAQGATERAGSNSDSRATESYEKGDLLFYGNTDALPDIWNDKDVPKALKSLIEMGIVRQLTLENGKKNSPESPSGP